jgi:2-dehydropantoate 2-reductase
MVQEGKLTSARGAITVAPDGNDIMRIAVMGSGAVGGYFGAKLAAAGHELAFIARGKHLAAMRADGLRVQSPNGDLLIRQAQCTDLPEQIGAVDLVLFCVKSYDTESAAKVIAPLVSERSQILSLQNGIDNPDKLARVYGAPKVLPGVVYIGAQLSAPGVITHSMGGKIIFGQMDGAVGERARELARTLTTAGIPAEASMAIRQAQWSKLLWNAPFCAISCLSRANTKEIVESAALSRLARECMAEVQAAARTQGIELPSSQFDEVMSFSRAMGAFKPSMLQDLEAGKPLEYDAFNGIVVRLLEANSQAGPVNRAFFATLNFLDQRIREARH